MIRIAAVLTVLLLGTGLWLATRPPVRPEALEPVTLAVEGLHCPIWCPIRVDRTLGHLPGLFDLEVDVETGELKANLDPKRISPEGLLAQLRQNGWSARNSSSSSEVPAPEPSRKPEL